MFSCLITEQDPYQDVPTSIRRTMKRYIDCAGDGSSLHTPVCLARHCERIRPSWVTIQTGVEVLSERGGALSLTIVGRLAKGYCSWEESPQSMSERPSILVIEPLKLEDLQGLAALSHIQAKGTSLTSAPHKHVYNIYSTTGRLRASLMFGVVPQDDDGRLAYKIHGRALDHAKLTEDAVVTLAPTDLVSGDHVQVEFHIVRATRGSNVDICLIAVSVLKLLSI